jgi:hypothetical protein
VILVRLARALSRVAHHIKARTQGFCSRRLLHPLTSVVVKRFGRLQDHPNHTRRQQAYETRQGAKSRAVERLQCSGLDEGLIETRMLMRTEGA